MLYKLISFAFSNGTIVIHPQLGRGSITKTNLNQLITDQGRLAFRAENQSYWVFAPDKGSGLGVRYILNLDGKSVEEVEVLKRTDDGKALIMHRPDEVEAVSDLIEANRLLVKSRQSGPGEVGVRMEYSNIAGVLLRSGLVEVKFGDSKTPRILDPRELVIAGTIKQGLKISTADGQDKEVLTITPDKKVLVLNQGGSNLVAEADVAADIKAQEPFASSAIATYYPVVVSMLEFLIESGELTKNTVTKVRDSGHFGKKVGKLLVKMGLDQTVVDACLRKIKIEPFQILHRNNNLACTPAYKALEFRGLTQNGPVSVPLFVLSMLLHFGMKVEPEDVVF